jgi:hypothetical protein
MRVSAQRGLRIIRENVRRAGHDEVTPIGPTLLGCGVEGRSSRGLQIARYLGNKNPTITPCSPQHVGEASRAPDRRRAAGRDKTLSIRKKLTP